MTVRNDTNYAIVSGPVSGVDFVSLNPGSHSHYVRMDGIHKWIYNSVLLSCVKTLGMFIVVLFG